MDLITTARPPLLLAAVSSELAGLDSFPPTGWQVRCTGVGVVMASIVTSKLLMTLKPSRVLVVGTCGSYDKNHLLVGDFLIVSEAISTSLDLFKGRAYRPVIEQYRWLATLNVPVDLDFPILPVAVTPGVTMTIGGAKLLSSIAVAEHLELTGIFAACHEADIPCGAILAVANQVGPKAHAQWLANHEIVSHMLIDTLRDSGIFDLL